MTTRKGYLFAELDVVDAAHFYDEYMPRVVPVLAECGAIFLAGSDAPNVKGVRRFNDRLTADTRVTATMVQTVSAKGYDGFAMALVL